MTQFNAVFRKELRHGWTWGLLGFLGTTVAMLYAVRTQIYYLNQVPTNERLSYTIASFFCAYAVGMILGVAQMFPENRGDKWGFLIHRPASRTTLFLAKSSAGLLIYSIAFGLPVAGALVWMAMPGHSPMPFDWRMGLPGVADLFCGMSYYFGGLLIATRIQSSPFGPIVVVRLVRLAAIGVPVVATFAIGLVPEFWQALLCGLVAILITGAAAWGAFTAGGQFETQPVTTRVATTLTFGAGLVCAAFCAVAIAEMFLPRADSPRYTSYRVASSGQIVEVVEESNVIVGVNDLDGRPLPDYQTPESRRNLNAGVAKASALLSPRPLYPGDRSYRATARLFVPIRSPETPIAGPVTWYYIYRHKLFAGYDNRSARLFGWLGPDGFTAGEERPARRFQSDPVHPEQFHYWGVALVAFPDAVYRINLLDRRIEKVFTPLPGESVVGTDSWRDSSNGRGSFDVIATTQRIVVQGVDGNTQLITPRDPRVHATEVSVIRPRLALGEPTFIWYVTQGIASQAIRYNSAGVEEARYMIPYRGFSDEHPEAAPILVVAAMTPVTVPAGFRLATHLTAFPDVFRSFSSALFIALWTLSSFASLISMALAYSRASAYAFDRTRLLVWSASGFLLGPVGYVLMRILLDWPAREKCPSCGRKRVVTRDICEHCGAAFKAPAPDGTEIFEQAV